MQARNNNSFYFEINVIEIIKLNNKSDKQSKFVFTMLITIFRSYRR